MPAKRHKPHENRTIVILFEEATYHDIIKNADRFREYLGQFIESYPNLFPPEIKNGFQMKDIRCGTNLEVPIRRIEVAGISYSIRPSFVLPSMTGYTKDAQHALFLRKFNVPFWALALVFGASAMRWWRLEQRLGRYSLVATTVQNPADLPEHIVADEKHSWLNGAKVYIATICGWGCILGASIAKAADEASLKKSYGVFKAEAQALKPDYQPVSILSDAWAATRLALQALFPDAALILCFLHVYLSLRDRSKYKHGATFKIVADKLWHCYHAVTQAAFSQRLRRFHQWTETADIPDFMKDKISKLYQQADAFRTGYISPFAHRTSNTSTGSAQV